LGAVVEIPLDAPALFIGRGEDALPGVAQVIDPRAQRARTPGLGGLAGEEDSGHRRCRLTRPLDRVHAAPAGPVRPQRFSAGFFVWLATDDFAEQGAQVSGRCQGASHIASATFGRRANRPREPPRAPARRGPSFA